MAPAVSTLSGRADGSLVQLLARIDADISTLTARALSAFNELLSHDSPLSARSDLAPRSELEPRNNNGPYVHPKSMSAGVLVIFSLLGASIGLLVLWLFVMKGGFIWKPTDWEDYKSSVLRRPGERPDDAITVFSDGSTRRAGGSTAGARTVVLGELDTTYTKSHVHKTFGPRPMGKKKTSVWGTGEGSIWGRLRGGGLNDNDTVVMREKEMRQVSGGGRSFVDKQEPARPRGWKPEDSDLSGYPDLGRGETTVRHPAKVRHSKSRAAASAAPASRPGRVKSTRTQKPPPQPRRIPSPEEEYTSSDTDTESDTESESDSDDDSIDQSQLGMAKGNKTYAHPLPMENILAGRSQAPIERNGGGAGGTYGSGVPVGHLVPVGPRALVHGGSREMVRAGRGYRKGSEGSLSSMDSIGSSRV
ncbi:uncharacterized protein H6S33_007673 [Morchella sextelata]|uniref:uncharacterized protein n=1 Tax=Morchella sextelata TaxID=1174677 RepID=UPI001D048A27|nr:uncharacterized protein H6S33_007673 [Morchella sextelata]KAH0603351.1 hypothetical protein H6S33_007673 [Morchella sextelata]